MRIVLGIIACVAALACGGESKYKADQPIREAEGAVRMRVPSDWELKKVSIADFGPGPQPGTLVGSFSAEVAPLDSLGFVVHTVDGTSVVREAMPKGQVA